MELIFQQCEVHFFPLQNIRNNVRNKQWTSDRYDRKERGFVLCV